MHHFLFQYQLDASCHYNLMHDPRDYCQRVLTINNSGNDLYNHYPKHVRHNEHTQNLQYDE